MTYVDLAGEKAMPDNEEAEDVVVIAKRSPKPTPEPRLIINFGEGGMGSIENPLFEIIRNALINETKFFISNDFSPEQKKIVLKAIEGLSNHPYFAAAFEALRQKHAIINVHPVTRSDQVQEDDGGTFDLNNGIVDEGSVINIYVRLERGEPYGLGRIAVAVVHELIHALGVPAFTARLDAPDSRWDLDVRNDIFKGYDYSATSGSNEGSAQVLVDPDSSNRLVGSVGNSVFVGSATGNIFMPVAGGNLFYTQSGNDEIHVVPGGLFDRLVNGGGSTIIEFPSTFQPNSLSILRSSDQATLSVLVAGKVELVIENASMAGSAINIRIAGQLYSLSSFPASDSDIATTSEAHIDFFGPYNGEQIGSVAISDSHGTQFYYRIGEISGAYAAESWAIGLNSGMLSGQFSKPDLVGSEFTSIIVVASDGITDAIISVTMRWAFSNEFEPTL